MSECKHEYLLDVQGGFYYCPNCPDEWTIQDLLKERIENRARIKALEEENRTLQAALSIDKSIDEQFGKARRKILVLEGVVEEIRGHVEFLEAGVDGVEGDIYKQNFYNDLKRTLSKLGEV